MVLGHFRVILGGAVTALIAGCQSDPHYGQYARNKPRLEDIVGIWSLDTAASDWRPASGNAATAHTLEFGSDGSVAARDVPDVWNFDNRRWKGEYENGTGKWSFKKNQDYWVLYLDLAEINGKRPGRGMMLHLAGQSPPYEILALIGDPDEGRALVFRKQRPAAEQ
jgi:hypothetical protein